MQRPTQGAEQRFLPEYPEGCRQGRQYTAHGVFEFPLQFAVIMYRFLPSRQRNSEWCQLKRSFRADDINRISFLLPGRQGVCWPYFPRQEENSTAHHFSCQYKQRDNGHIYASPYIYVPLIRNVSFCRRTFLHISSFAGSTLPFVRE